MKKLLCCIVVVLSAFPCPLLEAQSVVEEFRYENDFSLIAGLMPSDTVTTTGLLEVVDDLGTLAVIDAMVLDSGEVLAATQTAQLDMAVGETSVVFWADGEAEPSATRRLVRGDPDNADELDDIGVRREQKVAGLTGGSVDNTDIICRPHGSTDIDVKVTGPPLIYISVGGKSKGNDLPGWNKHLEKLKVLRDGGAVTKDGENPVPAGTVKVYLTHDTPQTVVDAAKNKLGDDCVVIFQDVDP